MSFTKISTSVLALVAVSAGAAAARDNVQVAGSSTVLPYASIVAEAFGENFDQSMENVALPAALQSLTCGSMSIRALDCCLASYPAEPCFWAAASTRA